MVVVNVQVVVNDLVVNMMMRVPRPQEHRDAAIMKPAAAESETGEPFPQQRDGHDRGRRTAPSRRTRFRAQHEKAASAYRSRRTLTPVAQGADHERRDQDAPRVETSTRNDRIDDMQTPAPSVFHDDRDGV